MNISYQCVNLLYTGNFGLLYIRMYSPRFHCFLLVLLQPSILIPRERNGVVSSMCKGSPESKIV